MDLRLPLIGEGSSSDPLRTFSPAEEQALSFNLRRVTEAISRGDHAGDPHDLSLLCRLHETLFEGVRDHGGRIRRQGVGSEFLIFGPNRSVHRDRVESELSIVFSKLRTSLRSLDDNKEAPEYDDAAIHIAVWTHAEIIRIHPFEDGNGRSSRSFLNSILVRQGLRSVAIEATKDEYVAVLNRYFESKDLRYVRDLYLRLYVEQLPNSHGN